MIWLHLCSQTKFLKLLFFYSNFCKTSNIKLYKYKCQGENDINILYLYKSKCPIAVATKPTPSKQNNINSEIKPKYVEFQKCRGPIILLL